MLLAVTRHVWLSGLLCLLGLLGQYCSDVIIRGIMASKL